MTLDKLIHYLKLDKQEFLFQFNSHPNYPSALAFSDTLNFLGVKNDAYELDKEYWDELPDEFIAIVDHSFSLVKKSGSHYSVYSDTSKTLPKEELHKSATNFVLLFEKTSKPEQKVTHYKPFIYFILGSILLYSVMNHSWYEVIFTILSLAGVYISLEIFNQKFGNTSAVIGSICGDTSVQLQNNPCHKIIHEDKTNILGLKFSDFSLIYFIGISVLALFLPATAFLLKGFALTSLIAIGYSLYVQAFLEKTFCKVCLLIISILIAQLTITLFLFGDVSFNLNIAALNLLLWGIVFFAISYFNTLLTDKGTLQKSNAKNLRFKRNYDLFKRALLDREKITFTDQQTFSIGHKNAKIHLSVISNPYCGFCKGAHEIVEDLLKKYPNDLSAQIRFNYFPERSNEKLTGLLSDFMTLYKNNSESDFMHRIKMWFEHRDEQQIKEWAGSSNEAENLTSLIAMSAENAAAHLNFTPILIINGYQFPDPYDREDIHYFIDELMEDDDI